MQPTLAIVADAEIRKVGASLAIERLRRFRQPRFALLGDLPAVLGPRRV